MNSGENSSGRLFPEKTLGRRGYKKKLTNTRTKLANTTTQLGKTAEQLLEQKALTDVALQRADTDPLNGTA